MNMEAFALDPNTAELLWTDAHIAEARYHIAGNHKLGGLIDLTEAQAKQLQHVFPQNRVSEARRLIKEAAEDAAAEAALAAQGGPMTHHLDKPTEAPKATPAKTPTKATARRRRRPATAKKAAPVVEPSRPMLEPPITHSTDE